MADDPKPGILRNLRIKRVSLVDLGANTDSVTGDGAHIMLYKRADPEMEKGGPNLTQTHVDTADMDERDDYEKATLDSASRNSLPDSAFAAVWTDSTGKKRRKLPIHDAGHLTAARGRVDGADIPASVKAAARRKIEAATNKKEKSVRKNFFSKFMELFNETDPAVRMTKAAELDKAFPDDLAKAHDSDDPMCKCADCMAKSAPMPEVSKAFTDIQKQHAELLKANAALVTQNQEFAKTLTVEIEKRQDAEIVTLLKTFKITPFDMTTDVAIYRKMRNDNPEQFDRVMKVMKAQDEMLAQSAHMASIGTGRVGEGSAWQQIVAKADSIIEKGGSKLTHEQAVEKVMLENPKLVAAYRAEQE